MTPERQKEVKAQIRARFATCMAGFKIRSEERRRSLILDHHALNMRFTK